MRTSPLQSLVLLAALWLSTILTCEANQDLRTWTLANGTSHYAVLIRYDEKSGVVVLRIGEKTDQEFKFDDFSAIDRAWLQEWLIIGEELEATLKRLGGKLERLEVKGKYLTEICVYHPTQSPPEKPLPMLILFDPTGKETRYVLRHFEAAEKVKMTLVACGSFRNNSDPEVEKGFDERIHEVMPFIMENVPHDPDKMFLGGTSGGAVRAYLYSTKFPGPWAGIYSNGGWLGGLDASPFPAMRVALVNGDKDEAANQGAPSQSKVLMNRGCEVAVIAFEGGHQFATVPVQIKAFRWLLGLQD